MGLAAVSNRIIIEKQAEKRDDDIVIPEGMSSGKKQESGVVLAVGPGRRLADGSFAALSIQVGDVVYYNPFGVTVLKHEDKEHLVLTEDDILAVIK